MDYLSFPIVNITNSVRSFTMICNLQATIFWKQYYFNPVIGRERDEQIAAAKLDITQEFIAFAKENNISQIAIKFQGPLMPSALLDYMALAENDISINFIQDVTPIQHNDVKRTRNKNNL